jgi:phage head maturation protease
MADELKRLWQAGLPVLKADNDSLTLTHFITTEHIDRYGEVVLTDGMEAPPNGVRVLWQHGFDVMRDMLPVGKSLDINGDTFKNVKGLVAKTQFYQPGIEGVTDQFPALLYDMHRQGVLDGWSIGFRPKMSEPRAVSIADSDETVDVLHYVKWVLFEYSSVAVPANPFAMNKAFMEAVKSGRLKQEDIDRWTGRESRAAVQPVKPEVQQPATQPANRGVVELLGAMSETKEG